MSDNAEPALPVFFDTSEVMPPKPEVALGRIASSKLRAAATRIGATLYVPDLVVEEAAHHRLRQLKERYGRLTEAVKILAPYVAVGAVGSLDESGVLDRLREETKSALAKIPVTIVPASASLDEVLAMSVRRVPPFKRTDDPTGVHDAVILLAEPELRENRRPKILHVCLRGHGAHRGGRRRPR